MGNVFEKQYYHNSIHSSNVDPFDDNDSSLESPKDHKRIEHIIRTGYVYFFSLSAAETISNRRIGQLPGAWIFNRAFDDRLCSMQLTV